MLFMNYLINLKLCLNCKKVECLKTFFGVDTSTNKDDIMCDQEKMLELGTEKCQNSPLKTINAHINLKVTEY